MIETSTAQADFNARMKGAPGGVGTPVQQTQSIPVSLHEARKQWSAAGYQIVDRTERKRRYAICKTCESFDNGRCRQCGCFMRIKSLLAGMTCKLSKW